MTGRYHHSSDELGPTSLRSSVQPIRSMPWSGEHRTMRIRAKLAGNKRIFGLVYDVGVVKPNLGDERISQKVSVAGGDAEGASTPGVFGVPFRTLLSREVRRFTRVWTQTLLSPLLTSALYIVVFGYGLGSRIRKVEGVPYLEFLFPGLILLSVISGSYGNTSSSLFDAKRERYIDEVLISPITAVGVSDVPPYPAIVALIVFAVLAFLGTTELLRRGYKLRY